jgi:saccharopine dehydrogenase (NAD+, L-lysine forming)
MTALIGIRREDKSEWERRVPITPKHAAELKQQGIEVIVQTSDIRAYEGSEFAEVGISVQEDLSDCPVILGIKEVPKDQIQAGKAYMFFAHVIKGQPYNMPMLQRLLDQGCTLIDYERVVDENNRRLIFFGWHAGVAGMIDTLWALGQRLAWEGIPNPFSTLRLTHEYRDLADAQAALAEVRGKIQTEGLPAAVTPLIIGVAGYGNVSRGVQEMLDLLPVIEIEPEEVAHLAASDAYSRHHVYKVVFREQHTVEPASPDMEFQLQDYYDHPERYRGTFAQYLPHLTVLVNAIFWTERYPRLVTRETLEELFAVQQPRLRVIGDVSCDVEGAIECTVKCTEPGDPVFVYDPGTGSVQDGYKGRGVVVMAVDILPSELPREASSDFSKVLLPYIPAIARCDYSVPFEDCGLPPEIKRAVITYQGALTPDYQYIDEYL